MPVFSRYKPTDVRLAYACLPRSLKDSFRINFETYGEVAIVYSKIVAVTKAVIFIEVCAQDNDTTNFDWYLPRVCKHEWESQKLSLNQNLLTLLVHWNLSVDFAA